MLSLYELLTQEAVEEHELFAACEQLFLSLLLYHLVGRPRINTKVTFARKLFSYAGKFLLQDHLHTLTKVICREQCAVRCTCQACARMLIIRQVYGMLGPAPRLLFKRLTVGARRTLWVNVFPTWQKMVELFNAEYGMILDFYTFQALPCFWIPFVHYC